MAKVGKLGKFLREIRLEVLVVRTSSFFRRFARIRDAFGTVLGTPRGLAGLRHTTVLGSLEKVAQ